MIALLTAFFVCLFVCFFCFSVVVFFFAILVRVLNCISKSARENYVRKHGLSATRALGLTLTQSTTLPSKLQK